MIRQDLKSISSANREGSLGEGVHLQKLVSRELVGYRKNLKRSCKIKNFYVVKNKDAKLFHGNWFDDEIGEN